MSSETLATGDDTNQAVDALDRLSQRTQARGTADWALGIQAGSRALLSDRPDAEPL